MNLSDLLVEVVRRGGCLAVEDGKLHYRGPRSGLTSSLRKAISQRKDELLYLLAISDSDSCVWPLQDAAELVFMWNHQGQPKISVSPGVTIACLEAWLCSNWSDIHVHKQVAAVRHFIWESLPEGEVPSQDSVLDQWRATSIPHWRNLLANATWSGDSATVKRARWMLQDILLDPDYEDPTS